MYLFWMKQITQMIHLAVRVTVTVTTFPIHVHRIPTHMNFWHHFEVLVDIF